MQKKINNWRIWDKIPAYGDTLYKRAVGKLEDMESAKALSEIFTSFYKPGMKVLDVGCGAGHYLRVLRSRLDENIDYTGLDTTKYYIQLARKAFGDNQKFLVGDIFDLPFNENTFDIVTCNNVILHLPPPPTKAISELIRVAKKYVVIRTAFGKRNYIIKEVRSSEEKIVKEQNWPKEIIDKNGDPALYNFFNMYTKQYIKNIINKIDRNIKIEILNDDKWKFFSNRKLEATATRIIDGKQVAGNLILDWKFIILEK